MRTLTLVIGSVALVACAQTARVEAGGDVSPATPVNRNYLPAGTTLNARLNQTLGTSSSREGDQFTATVSDAVIAQNGATAVPAGATLHGHVTGLHNGTIPGDQSLIRLQFDSLAFNGRSYPFDASIASVNVQSQQTNNPSSTARGAVTGAAAGAVLGAIISGGELSKIITGGLLGAAAGTVISLGRGGTQSVIPAGSVMTVRATQGVQVR